MKKFIAYFIFCLPLILTTSCGKKSDSETNKESSSGSKFIGTWEAKGPHPMGYNYGSYSIIMNILKNGECKVKVIYDTTDSPMSFQFTDTIDLVGSWDDRKETITTTLSVVSWVTTNRSGYRKEKGFEKFDISYDWEIKDNQMIIADDHFERFKVGTTKEAREGGKMIVEGTGLQMGPPKFIKLVVEDSVQTEIISDSETTKVDPVGEWTTKDHTPKLSLCFWESGEARGEFEALENSIYIEGRWQVVKDGRWIGYVTFSGKVTYWGRGQNNVTPKDEKFVFLFDPTDSKLTYVKGGDLKDKNGDIFYPSGMQANQDPVLHKQNTPRPIRMESGNK